MKFDEIGYWSEVKLEIVREYAAAYSKILAAQESPRLYHVYVDGFSGAGVHVAKRTGEFVKGSPLNALAIDPPFREYFLVDLDGDKVEHLRGLVGDRQDVHLLAGDCNQVLLDKVFPHVRWDQYRRGLCLLDPYGLHLDWRVIEAAGRMNSIDLFLNFPIMDINRNALWRNPAGVDPADAERMTAFWGDDSWCEVVYRPARQVGFDFAGAEVEKAANAEVAEAFRKRLQQQAGFKRVPEPMPMRNSTGAVVYYLYFASQKDVAEKVAVDIFARHRGRGC
ncbi:MAG: three-Cys-motif partner protein TcmP [Myxococcota bacterium]|nr:three-Cys-motif partner protein TcmP [Myxococcota bacterium]